MSVIQSSGVIGKNEDGSDITQDVDVLVWWRDVGKDRFPRVAVMACQFLTMSVVSATAERVFSLAGLEFSDLYKSLSEGTLETIMWVKCGSPSRGDHVGQMGVSQSVFSLFLSLFLSCKHTLGSFEFNEFHQSNVELCM
jgi:hypothetical protein